MARAKGMLNLSGNLEVLAGAPLDARDRVPTKADLTVASNFPYPYVGMETYVIAEDKKYRFIGDDITDINDWEETDSGGSGGSAELESDVTANTTVGAIASGQTLAQGTSFTEFVQKLLISEVAPTVGFSISKSGNVAKGTSWTETLWVNGAPLFSKIYVISPTQAGITVVDDFTGRILRSQIGQYAHTDGNQLAFPQTGTERYLAFEKRGSDNKLILYSPSSLSGGGLSATVTFTLAS